MTVPERAIRVRLGQRLGEHWGMAAAKRLVTAWDVAEGIERLDLSGEVVELHVSLRSFPRLDGGPQTLVDSFLEAGCTVLVPTMANEAFAVPAPNNDRPARNGIDYATEDQLLRRRPAGVPDRYHASRTETDSGLGATPAYVAARQDRLRCQYAVGTFSAIGPRARDLIDAETPADVFGPLRALAALNGAALLVGVSLTKLTLVHLAETEAGRRPFIRWTRGSGGTPTRFRCGECSMGFDNLAQVLEAVELRTTVGASLWRAFPAPEVVARAAAAIRAQPTITQCPNPGCIECADALAGGPTE